MSFFDKSIFEEIIIKNSTDKNFYFETKLGEKINENYFKNNDFYFKETGYIKSLEELERIYKAVIKTKYDKGIIGYAEKNELDCFYLTKYFPKRLGNLNQHFIYDFKEGKNTEYYANIFSEVILDLMGTEKNFLNTITIVPIPASTKEKNEKRYKKLFELISKKTGVINGYDFVYVTEDREASHILGKDLEFTDNTQIDFFKFKSPIRIILIDDVITTGKSLANIANQLRNFENIKKFYPLFNSKENKYNNFIIGLTLANTILEENYYDNNSSFFKGNDFFKIDTLNHKKSIDLFRIFTDDHYNFLEHNKFISLNRKEIKEKKHIDSIKSLSPKEKFEKYKKIYNLSESSEDRYKKICEQYNSNCNLYEKNVLGESISLTDIKNFCKKKNININKFDENSLKIKFEKCKFEVNEYYKNITNNFFIYNENIFGYNIDVIPYFYFIRNRNIFSTPGEYIEPEYHSDMFAKLINKLFNNKNGINIKEVTIIPLGKLSYEVLELSSSIDC